MISGFMQPQIEHGAWWMVDGNCGIDYIPADFCGADEIGDFVESTHFYGKPEIVIGYGARLSAPGYMDCTEWCVFATEQEARDYLEEMYGD